MPLPDSSSCHHCHIHAPIPAQDLKRTHPLRSHFIEKDGGVAKPRNTDLSHKNSFRKNVSFLYRKISRRNNTNNKHEKSQTNVCIAIPPLPPPLPARVVDDRPAVVVDCLPPPEGFRPPRPAVVPVVGHRRRGLAGLQAVLLVGAYALLLVLAVVIGVVLSQVQRPRFRQPPFPNADPIKVVRPGAHSSGSFRVNRPRASSGSAPRPAPPSTRQPDFDYYDANQGLALLPNPVSAAPTSPPRPVPAPAPQPASNRRAPASSARRTTQPLGSADEDFRLDAEETPRGRKEPDVKILKSWSHHNHDGTFSWGYINDDGSYKNETRGLDCVVRGVYGYVETETGQQLSFPYESGNPCDPDAPDYYYDYDVVEEPVASDGREARGQFASSASQNRRQG